MRRHVARPLRRLGQHPHIHTPAPEVYLNADIGRQMGQNILPWQQQKSVILGCEKRVDHAQKARIAESGAKQIRLPIDQNCVVFVAAMVAVGMIGIGRAVGLAQVGGLTIVGKRRPLHRNHLGRGRAAAESADHETRRVPMHARSLPEANPAHPGYWLPAPSYRLQATGYGLRTTDYRLPATGYRLRAALLSSCSSPARPPCSPCPRAYRESP